MESMPAPSTHVPALRDLPSVDFLLRHVAIASLADEFPREELAICVRAVLNDCRDRIARGEAVAIEPTALAIDIRRTLHERRRPRLRRVINATGIVLHTGLGRAPLCDEALAAIQEVCAGYCNLELSLESGQRGDRHDHVRDILRELTGAEDALVVNNNAAATFLALHTLARGRAVIVSRGQLVEIGGSYRMPDIMSSAGCAMIEVGTTNRTHLHDFENALSADTAALLRVHTSNYRIVGFTESPALEDLVRLAQRAPNENPIRVIDDLGSGLLDDSVPSGGGQSCLLHAWDEPTVRESVAAGADLTLFSGDKLLGGPQSGILVGRAACIRAICKNPLMRTYRPDKLTLAALEATLQLYRDPATLRRRLPILRMLGASLAHLEATARKLAERVSAHAEDVSVDVAAGESLAGGGALPTVPFPTWSVQVRHSRLAPEAIARALRNLPLPVIGRVHSDALVLDCRTLAGDEVDAIPAALAEAIRDALDA